MGLPALCSRFCHYIYPTVVLSPCPRIPIWVRSTAGACARVIRRESCVAEDVALA